MKEIIERYIDIKLRLEGLAQEILSYIKEIHPDIVYNKDAFYERFSIGSDLFYIHFFYNEENWNRDRFWHYVQKNCIIGIPLNHIYRRTWKAYIKETKDKLQHK